MATPNDLTNLIIDAVMWKLGLTPKASAAANMWEQLTAMPGFERHLQSISQQLGVCASFFKHSTAALTEALHRHLSSATKATGSAIENEVQFFRQWVGNAMGLRVPMVRKKIAHGLNQHGGVRFRVQPTKSVADSAPVDAPPPKAPAKGGDRSKPTAPATPDSPSKSTARSKSAAAPPADSTTPEKSSVPAKTTSAKKVTSPADANAPSKPETPVEPSPPSAPVKDDAPPVRQDDAAAATTPAPPPASAKDREAPQTGDLGGSSAQDQGHGPPSKGHWYWDAARLAKDSAPPGRQPPAKRREPQSPTPPPLPQRELAPAAQWKFEPPTPALDVHTEYDSRSMVTDDGAKVIGARVRGRKHKHDGTHCDDWFEFQTSGPWTIVAVADGAGSKKFSRVGAEHASKAACEYLQKTLATIRIQPRDAWTGDVFQRDESNWRFQSEDLEQVQRALHGAMQAAFAAINQAATARFGNPAHRQILGREIEFDDMACTLLLAVHMPVIAPGGNIDLVMSCQIGDGITAAISMGGGLILMGEPARGDHAGETEFISDIRKLQPAYLSRKTYLFPGKLRALLLMTDGVADDYFPNDPHLLRLYADLVLNGVIEVQGNGASKSAAPPAADIASDIEQVERLVGPDQRQIISLRSAEKYIAVRKLDAAALIKEPGQLEALSASAKASPPMRNEDPPEAPEKRLELWLDSYRVRGSFDDRTLVALLPAIKRT